VEHADATAAAGEFAEPLVPLDFVGYCLDCFYNLRGLPAARCPECGRTFDPERPTTYSRTPYPEPRRAFASRAVAPTAPEPIGMASHVARLWCANAELRRCLALLSELLIAKGVLTAEELAEITRVAVQSAEPLPAIEAAGPDPVDRPDAGPAAS
jgi:hypothetical protein